MRIWLFWKKIENRKKRMFTSITLIHSLWGMTGRVNLISEKTKELTLFVLREHLKSVQHRLRKI